MISMDKKGVVARLVNDVVEPVLEAAYCDSCGDAETQCDKCAVWNMLETVRSIREKSKKKRDAK